MNRLLLIVRVRIVVSVSAVVTLMALLSPGQASAETGYTVPFYASWSITCNYGEICLGQTHQGIDYSVGNNLAGGEVIAAAAAGSAKYCTDVYPWGKSVVIRHDTTNRTLYLHLSNWARGEGSTADVARGEIIGYEGSTGYSTGPHLHFEVRPNASNFLCPYEGLNGTPSDPANYWQDNPPNHADFSPAIASWVSTRVDMFVRGENNELYQRTRSGGSWGSWFRPFAPGGTCLRSAPAATTWSTSRWDVFVRGCDNAIWRVWWDGSWHSQSLGGCTLGAPGASSWGTNRIDVLVRGCDNVLYWTATNNGGAGWSTWSTIGPGTCLRSGPSAVSWGYNRIDLVYRSCSDAIVHHWYTGTWQPAESFYGCTMVAPAIASRGGNYLDVFHRACGPANNEGIIQKSWNGSSWTAWTDISPGTDCLASGPGADAWAPEMLDVPYRGCGSPDNAFIAYSNGGGWTHSFFGSWP